MRDHDVLAALPDVARLTVHAGQVLFYPRHTPPGVFVVVSGVVCRFVDGTLPEAGCGDRLDAASGAFAVPAPHEVAEPAKAGVLAATDVEILFVPRSVVLQGVDVAGTLTAAGVAVVPLGESAPRPVQVVSRRRVR
jgi:hypothetical protein